MPTFVCVSGDVSKDDCTMRWETPALTVNSTILVTLMTGKGKKYEIRLCFQAQCFLKECISLLASSPKYITLKLLGIETHNSSCSKNF